MVDSFSSHGTFEVGGRRYGLARLEALERRGWNLSRLPFSMRILLENLLRREDGVEVRTGDELFRIEDVVCEEISEPVADEINCGLTSCRIWSW